MQDYKNLKIVLIAAMGKNRVIGNKNKLPWKIKEDYDFFKSTVLGHALIMGRKTFEAMGKKKLPGCETFVLSRTPGVGDFTSLELALNHLDQLESKHVRKTVFICGGEEIYRQALEYAESIILTEITREFPGDAFFPEFDHQQYKAIKRRKSETSEIPFEIVWYQRMDRAGGSL